MKSLLPLLTATALLAGCAPLTSRYQPVPVRIEVRDAVTGMPLDDALISGGVDVAFNPSTQPGVLGRPGGIPGIVEINEPSSWKTRTDVHGIVLTDIAGGNPSSITIRHRGYATIRSVIHAGERTTTNHRLWSHGTTTPDDRMRDERRMEFRVVPATPAP